LQQYSVMLSTDDLL